MTGGFTSIPNEVLRDPDLPLPAKVLVGVIRSRSGLVDATILRRELGISRSTVYTHLAELERRGLIEVDRWREGRIWRTHYRAIGIAA